MGRYPVTVAEYKEFLHRSGRGKPVDWAQQLAHPNWPVTTVSWYDAEAYCAWIGGRLPTEIEWEYAARRGRAPGTRYPWGDEPPDATRANYGEGGPRSPTPVGLYPSGASFGGVQDMAGNVWEWTASDYSDRTKVLRGGAWGNSPQVLRVSYRDADLPMFGYDVIGFRCVRELLSA